MKIVFADNAGNREEILSFIEHFDITGDILAKGKRNTIKLFSSEGKTLAVKSFRVPNPINALIYRFFRKSKAERSFEFAQRLIEMGIGTPEPVGYAETNTLGFLGRSYYISEYLEPDFTFKELVANPDRPGHESILRKFTAFCFLLHEKGVEFLDHTPGNTLIKNNGSDYSFMLVDLNRMNFHRTLTIEQRMKNLSRLTPKIEMVSVIASEYSKLAGLPEKFVFDLLWNETQKFQAKFRRKKRIKRNLKLIRNQPPILLCL